MEFMWDAGQYLKFTDERARPFFDLLAQVQLGQARSIVDLGCGPGHLTRILSERWPDACVVGVDNSTAMLEQARQLAVPGRLEFVEADIAAWAATGPVDLLLSNAALQWVPDHGSLLGRLAGMVAAKGTLAVQVPNRFCDTPAQTAIEQATADPRWASKLQGVGLHRESVQPLSWYVRRLLELGFTVNGWETTYAHVLTGENPVLDWLKGTALRPLLERLSPDEVQLFLAEVGARFKAAYPAVNGKTLFPFPRLFFVAKRQSAQKN
jgi:trans-aconitate 2-methyltransferase